MNYEYHTNFLNQITEAFFLIGLFCDLFDNWVICVLFSDSVSTSNCIKFNGKLTVQKGRSENIKPTVTKEPTMILITSNTFVAERISRLLECSKWRAYQQRTGKLAPGIINDPL
jgi:hypothetical protein